MHLQCLSINEIIGIRDTLTTHYRIWRILLFGCLLALYGLTTVHFSAREKIMQISQNEPLTQFLFMHLNVACITNIHVLWCDNIYVMQIYATAA